jgi:hypothetical protein
MGEASPVAFGKASRLRNGKRDPVEAVLVRRKDDFSLSSLLSLDFWRDAVNFRTFSVSATRLLMEGEGPMELPKLVADPGVDAPPMLRRDSDTY